MPSCTRPWSKSFIQIITTSLSNFEEITEYIFLKSPCIPGNWLCSAGGSGNTAVTVSCPTDCDQVYRSCDMVGIKRKFGWPGHVKFIQWTQIFKNIFLFYLLSIILMFCFGDPDCKFAGMSLLQCRAGSLVYSVFFLSFPFFLFFILLNK